VHFLIPVYIKLIPQLSYNTDISIYFFKKFFMDVLFYRSLLEYDADAFTKISFLFEWNDFFFIFLSKFSVVYKLCSESNYDYIFKIK